MDALPGTTHPDAAARAAERPVAGSDGVGTADDAAPEATTLPIPGLPFIGAPSIDPSVLGDLPIFDELLHLLG